MAYYDAGPAAWRTKGQNQRDAKPPVSNSGGVSFADDNDTGSRSDSDKVEGSTARVNNSIFAVQRQRRRNEKVTFQRKMEERRKSRAAGILQNQGQNDASWCAKDPPSDGHQCQAAVTKVDSPQELPEEKPAEISPSDSGYVTRKEVAPLIASASSSVQQCDPEPQHSTINKDIPQPPIHHGPPPLLDPKVTGHSGLTVSPVSPVDSFFMVNGHYYRILNQIGKGGSSQVYQVFDEERKLCLAVKRVDLSDADETVVMAYRNEIELLKRLQKYPKRVVIMYDYEYCPAEQRLSVVMEKGDTDLASLFKSRQGEKLPDQMISFYWLEMLKAVQVIHQEGIVHSDLKPANFLLVAGNLKLIDFGIANAVPANRTSVTRECQMGTLNYISPESVACVETGSFDMKRKVSVKSDVWSLGCILYNMVYGKTPLQDIRNPMAKMAALLKPSHLISYPPVADGHVIDVMKRCLERDSRRRTSIDELLRHPYLKSYDESEGACGSSSSSVTDYKLRMLAETVSKATPRTGARLIKAAMQQAKGENADASAKPPFPKMKL